MLVKINTTIFCYHRQSLSNQRHPDWQIYTQFYVFFPHYNDGFTVRWAYHNSLQICLLRSGRGKRFFFFFFNSRSHVGYSTYITKSMNNLAIRCYGFQFGQIPCHPFSSQILGTCDSKACCCRGIVAWIFSESLSSLGLLIPRNVIKLVFAARNVICIVLTTVVFANLLAVFDALVTKLKFQCNT